MGSGRATRRQTASHADARSRDSFTVEYSDRDDEYPDVDVTGNLVAAAMGYADGATVQVRDVTGVDDGGFDVTIDSDIPLGAGLGTSAAVAVAAIDDATRELGLALEREEHGRLMDFNHGLLSALGLTAAREVFRPAPGPSQFNVPSRDDLLPMVGHLAAGVPSRI